MKLYSNEIVFRGHPDKVCDQISDALLDAYLANDKNSRCGIETMGGKGKIFITGEVTSTSIVNVEEITKRVLRDIGYNDNYEIINNIGVQSPDIALGVDVGGAGDQGIMFGYACDETESYMPYAIDMAHKLSKRYRISAIKSMKREPLRGNVWRSI
jgi:S-adenosylmethionine synthetase